MNINFLDEQKISSKNRDDVIKLKQDEIAKLQNEIAVKENKLLKFNDRYFKVVNDKAKMREYNTLIDDLVKLRLKLHTVKNDLTLYEESYKFEYDVDKIVSELTEQAEKAELQKRIENIEANLQEAKKEAEELAVDLFEYNNLITNTVNVYKTNVSDSNADIATIEKTKQVIYDFHNSHVAHLVEKYPTYYYLPKECIFKRNI